MNFISIVIMLLIIPIVGFAGNDRFEIDLNYAVNPVYMEITPDKKVRLVGSDASRLKNPLMYEGFAQSIALPTGSPRNLRAIEKLKNIGITVIEVTSPKASDIVVIMNRGTVWVYEGEKIPRPISFELPIEPRFLAENTLSNLFVNWKVPTEVVYSFRSHAMALGDTSGDVKTFEGSYIDSRVNRNWPRQQFSTKFNSDVRLTVKSQFISIEYKTNSESDYQVYQFHSLNEAQKRIEQTQILPTHDPTVETASVAATDDATVVIDPSALRKIKPAFETYINAFRHALELNVFGQPEAIEILVDIEKQNILTNGKRIVPEIAMFLGLPGVGKDTLVEAYIYARAVARGDTFDRALQYHVHRTPKAKSKGDTWAFTGSGTGYIGSKEVSPLIRFVVDHSGGRYKISYTKGNEASEFVEENLNWKPGQVVENTFAPEDGVIFVNEFHDWSKEMKNVILKEALERGYFTVGNPGPGVNRVEVPITIILASNDGMNLIASRNRDGERVGAPLTEEQLMVRRNLNASDKAALKDELRHAMPTNPEGGTSEEVLSRIPNSRIVLLRPHTNSSLRKVVEKLFGKLQLKYLRDKALDFPSIKIEFTSSLKNFLVGYDQLAEEGARPIEDKVKSLVEKTLSDAVFSGRLKLKEGDVLKIGIRANKDGTFSLTVNSKSFLIQDSENKRDVQPISDDKIDKLVKLEEELNKRVKGVQNIIKDLARDIRLSMNTEKPDHAEKETKTADVYAFLGTSSTGKSELAIALHQVLFETKSEPFMLDGSQIQSEFELKQKILGYRDAQNRPVPSLFMEAYDRSNGKLVLVLDEITNANRDVLKGLYDLLRKAVPAFADGKARPMRSVKIILTGNLSEEWYAGIPRDAPEAQQLEAARKIYNEAVADEGFKRNFLMKHLSEAFLNRIGLQRIYFFGPHTEKTSRQVIQLKLVKAIKDFSASVPGRRSWKLKFESDDDYVKTIEAIEKYGFKIWEQSASIVNFVDKNLMAEIHDRLLVAKVPDGAEVVIRKIDDKFDSSSSKVKFELLTNGAVLPLEVRGKGVPKTMRIDQKEVILTAYHEAGHEIVNRILLGDKIKAGGISIIPGVVEINGNWILYEGLARHRQVEKMTSTPEVVIARMAVIMGGEAGEMLVTKTERLTAGKSNDIQRATSLARKAILTAGLSEKWGHTAPEHQSLDGYVNGLSEARRRVLEKEVALMLEEARTLARRVLIANYNSLFNPLGAHLAEKGEIKGEALERFYRRVEVANKIVVPGMKLAVDQAVADYETKVKKEAPPVNLRDFEFNSFTRMPATIADPEAIRNQRRAAALAAVDLSPGYALVKNSIPITAGRCELLFK